MVEAIISVMPVRRDILWPYRLSHSPSMRYLPPCAMRNPFANIALAIGWQEAFFPSVTATKLTASSADETSLQ
jgi:hypothetical protein